MAQRFARVIPLLRLQRNLESFTYEIPANHPSVVRGSLVWIPFRSRIVGGVVEQSFSQANPRAGGIKPIASLISNLPLSENFFRTAEHLQKNFAISPGLAFKTMLPNPLKRPRASDAFFPTPRQSPLRIKRARLDSLKTAQANIQRVLRIKKNALVVFADENEKWAMVLALLRPVLDQSQQALIIVPDEVHLGAWHAVLNSQFPKLRMGIASSTLSQSHQFLNFELFRSGQSSVMLGTKSSVFHLGPKLRLILCDAEEAESHKQYDQNPRYDVRELLRFYEQLGLTSIKFSTAPTTEGYSAAVHHETLIDLGSPSPLPKIQTIDREQELRTFDGTLLPERMRNGIQQCFDRGQRAFVFFNRKGFAKLLRCRDCQATQRCPTCTWPLELQSSTRVFCPSCGNNASMNRCGKCNSLRLRPARYGLSALGSEIAEHFPHHRVQLLDSDHPPSDNGADITCGSQFALPRLPWSDIGYVGWITPELTLPASGFQNSDRMFQTLKFFQTKLLNTSRVQIEVLTYVPQHPCFRFANEGQISHYYRHELDDRRDYGYPPAQRLLKLIFFDRDDKVNQSLAIETRKRLLALRCPQLREVSDPFVPSSDFGRGKHRWALLVKLDPETELDCCSILPEHSLVDLDPLTL